MIKAMFKKEIHIPAQLSSNSVFELINKHFKGRYITIIISDKELRIKKIHSYSYSNKGYELMKLRFTDSGYFLIENGKLIFQIELGRQIFFWFFMVFVAMILVIGILEISFFASLTIIFMPVVIYWVFGLMRLSVFVTSELDNISTKMKKMSAK